MALEQSRPELLAPAGDWESMRAAVTNGADAVYFGLSRFNARARATNFEVEELPRIMQFLHDRNVRGFVTMNTLIFSDELPDVAEFVAAMAAARVDAVIVQDLGLVRLIRAIAPDLTIHGSTQMTLTEPRGIEFVRQLGVERVVLARELSLAEIRKVTAATDMPVEVFIHGALCVAYSGQCLTSEALGGRSANRGQCAQACRLPYEMIVDGKQRDLGDRAYLLSPQDLAAYDRVDDLIDAGVISFKIEGRLKGGPYVAVTTQTYRRAIDAALENKPFSLERREELDLAQTFSRGLTTGFLDGVNHQVLVRGRFPKSRGILIGHVLKGGPRFVRIRLSESVPHLVNPGDGVVFDLGTPQEQEPGGRVWQVRPHRERPEVELLFAPDAADFSDLPVGAPVWKTDDPALRKRLEQSYAQDRGTRKRPLRAHLAGTLGSEISLTFRSGEKHATAVWPGPLETAQRRPTNIDEIREQLGRLGDTPYELGELTLALPDNVMLPRSVLNDLRRRAIQDLASAETVPTIHPNALSDLRAKVVPPARLAGVSTTTPTLSVVVRNLGQLDRVLQWSSDRLPRPAAVYCDFEDLRGYKEAVPRARAAGMPIALATLRVWKPGEEGFQAPIVRAEPDMVLVRNLASLVYFRETLPGARLIGDFSLNIANELTADLLHRQGLMKLVPSFDLNWDQFQGMIKESDPTWFEPVLHQHMPMFHNEFCVFAAFLSKGKDHTDCGRPCERHKIELRDRVGSTFPVLPDTGCRNTVFNSVPQSAAEYVGRMKELGIRWFRVDLLRETPEEVVRLIEQYTRVISGVDDGKQTWKQLRALNQLGVTRGTLNLL